MNLFKCKTHTVCGAPSLQGALTRWPLALSTLYHLSQLICLSPAPCTLYEELKSGYYLPPHWVVNHLRRQRPRHSHLAAASTYTCLLWCLLSSLLNCFPAAYRQSCWGSPSSIPQVQIEIYCASVQCSTRHRPLFPHPQKSGIFRGAGF